MLYDPAFTCTILLSTVSSNFVGTFLTIIKNLILLKVLCQNS